MALDAVKNFAKATVSTGYDDVAVEIVLSSGEGANFPEPSVDGEFNVVWWNSTDYADPADDPNVEIVRVTARSTDTLTVTRAQESTAATVKNTGGKTYKMLLGITKKMIDDFGVNFLAITGATAGATSQAQVFTNGVIANTITGGIDTTSSLYLKTTSGVGTTGADMHFLVGDNGATEAMTILNNGNVGIGTTSPLFKLTVGSGSNSNVSLNTNLLVQDSLSARLGASVGDHGTFISSGDASTYGGLFAYNYLAGAALNLVLNEYGGNVGIGTTTPTAKLHLAAGTASIAPLKFTSGVSLTTPEAGTMEFTDDSLYFTITTGPTRKTISFTSDLDSYVAKSTFDAHTILYATTDNTPAALSVTEQTLVGRLTGGNISAVAIGIADNNIVQIDSADVADNEYARFTATGLESRSTSEVLSDIGAQSTLTFGIANTNAVQIDSADVADNEYARFTATGLESRTAAEVLADMVDADIATFLVTPTSANLASAIDDETGTGALVFGTAPTFTTSITTPAVLATANDSGAIGAAETAFSDLFLASGAVINFNNSNMTLTHAAGSLTLSAGALIMSENASLQYDPSLSEDGKYTGTTITGTAGVALAFGDLIYLDPTDSRWELADANIAAGSDGDPRGILGLCVQAAAGDGNATTILLQGVIRADTAFPSFTINAPIYVSETAGDVVVTQPSATDVVIRVVGFGLTSDSMYFNPSNDYITHT